MFSLGSNLFLSLFFTAILTHLWGLIRGIQYPITLFLLAIIYPGNADAFLRSVTAISALDLFHGESITEVLFSFGYGDALNDHWDNFGAGGMNFLENIGSIMIPILASTLVYYGVIILVHYIATKNHH